MDSDEDIVTLKASGRDFRFEATHIRQVDSILAYLVKMKDKASKRRTSREAVGVTDQVQALLDAIPKAFSHLKPQALAVFCDVSQMVSDFPRRIAPFIWSLLE